MLVLGHIILLACSSIINDPPHSVEPTLAVVSTGVQCVGQQETTSIETCAREKRLLIDAHLPVTSALSALSDAFSEGNGQVEFIVKSDRCSPNEVAVVPVKQPDCQNPIFTERLKRNERAIVLIMNHNETKITTVSAESLSLGFVPSTDAHVATGSYPQICDTLASYKSEAEIIALRPSPELTVSEFVEGLAKLRACGWQNTLVLHYSEDIDKQ